LYIIKILSTLHLKLLSSQNTILHKKTGLETGAPNCQLR